MVSTKNNTGLKPQTSKVQSVHCLPCVGKADSENFSIFRYPSWKDSEGFESISGSLWINFCSGEYYEGFGTRKPAQSQTLKSKAHQGTPHPIKAHPTLTKSLATTGSLWLKIALSVFPLEDWHMENPSRERMGRSAIGWLLLREKASTKEQGLSGVRGRSRRLGVPGFSCKYHRPDGSMGTWWEADVLSVLFFHDCTPPCCNL